MENLEKNGEVLAKKIIKTFQKKNYFLNFNRNNHLMIRLYRTTKNDFFINPIIEKVLIDKEKMIKDIENLENEKYIKKQASFHYNLLKKQKGLKAKKRVKIFQKYKEFLFYHHLIYNIYLWKSLSLNKTKLKPYFLKSISFFNNLSKNESFTKFLFKKEVIRHFGVELINSIYYLFFLGVVDFRKKFKKEFKKVFNNKDDATLSDYIYKNKIYSLTHFIIAGSNYYQKYVSKKEFLWIISYFKKNIKTILKRTNPDIVSEVGLCFKLTKTKLKDLNLLRKYLINQFNKRVGYIPRGKGDINSSEHTAAVAYLFLSGFKKLYKGPDITKAIKPYL